MANRYWVGGTGTWDGTTTHWSDISGGVSGASVPTSADNVLIDANSGSSPVITIGTTSACLDLNFTGAITPTFSANGFPLNIYGSLALISAMTWSYNTGLTMSSTTIGNTITTAGKTFNGQITFNGVGGGWIFQDNFTSIDRILIINGSVDFNGKTFTIVGLESNFTNTRTITFGAATLNCSGFWSINSTGLTFNAGTSTINSSYGFTWYGGGLIYNNVTFSVSTTIGSDSNTFNALRVAAGITLVLPQGVTTTITSFISDGIPSNRSSIHSTTAGVPANITLSTTTTTSNLIVQDISKAGAGTLRFSNSIDVSGNTGIDFCIRYWVGGTGTWGDGTTTHWSKTSGGASGASVPTNFDTVHFDAASFTTTGLSCTVSGSGAFCLDMNWTGALNNPTFNRTFTVDISGSLTFISGMTHVGSGSVTFSATSTGQVITTVGASLVAVTFNGIGGGWTLQDALTSTGRLTLTNGTLNTNGKDLTCAEFFGTGTTTRTLTLGASTITCTAWTFTTTTSLTLNPGTSTIIMTGYDQTFAGGSFLIYNNVTFLTSGYISGSNTFNVLTLPSGSYIKVTSSTQQKVTSLLGNGADATKFIRLQAFTPGTTFTLQLVNATVVDYYSFKDVNRTGTGSLTVTHGYNNGNNTGITFTNTLTYATPLNRYWVGKTAVETWGFPTATWSEISGGTGGAVVPATTNNVIFDANSFPNTGMTVSFGGGANANCLDLDFSAVTNTPTISGSVGAQSFNIKGSLTLSPNMNYTATATMAFSSTSSSTKTISTAGQVINANITLSGTSGGWSLLDDLNCKNITHTGGNLNTNGMNVSCSVFDSSTTTARTLTLGASTITCTGWTLATTTLLTFNANTSTIIVNGANSFSGGGLTYNNVKFISAITTIIGSNTFNTLTFTAGKTVKGTAGTTQTIISSLGVIGSSGSLVSIQSTVAASLFTLSKASGNVIFNYCSITDCTVSGGATFNAYNSTNVSGNTGINFLAGNPPYYRNIIKQTILKVSGAIPIKVNGI